MLLICLSATSFSKPEERCEKDFQNRWQKWTPDGVV
jgi:hypothetical protein